MSIFFIFLHFFRNQTDRKERLYKCSFDYSGKKNLKEQFKKATKNCWKKTGRRKEQRKAKSKIKLEGTILV